MLGRRLKISQKFIQKFKLRPCHTNNRRNFWMWDKYVWVASGVWYVALMVFVVCHDVRKFTIFPWKLKKKRNSAYAVVVPLPPTEKYVKRKKKKTHSIYDFMYSNAPFETKSFERVVLRHSFRINTSTYMYNCIHALKHWRWRRTIEFAKRDATHIYSI